MTMIKHGITLTIALSLSACTYVVSQGVTRDGTVTGDVIFPDIADATLPEGIFPNRDNLEQIIAGTTKKQMYHLIGRPHFHEANGAKEWDYILRFRSADKQVKTCQYKVIYDHKNIARQFYWQPANCLTQRLDLSADALFPFGQGGVQSIKAAGKVKLGNLAQRFVKSKHQPTLHIVGYTDHLGQSDSNLTLSRQRADSVKRYLVNQGVNADLISTEGKGESNPVVQCDKTLTAKALVACLAPNRRVSITID